VSARGKKIAWGSALALAGLLLTCGGYVASASYKVAQAATKQEVEVTAERLRAETRETASKLWEANRVNSAKFMTRDEVKPQLEAIQRTQAETAADVRQMRDWLRPNAK
jgi:hypothetical protein